MTATSAGRPPVLPRPQQLLQLLLEAAGIRAALSLECTAVAAMATAAAAAYLKRRCGSGGATADDAPCDAAAVAEGWDFASGPPSSPPTPYLCASTLGRNPVDKCLQSSSCVLQPLRDLACWRCTGLKALHSDGNRLLPRIYEYRKLVRVHARHNTYVDSMLCFEISNMCTRSPKTSRSHITGHAEGNCARRKDGPGFVKRCRL